MRLPRSIRGKVSLTATVISAVAMMLIVATVAFATQLVLKNAVSDSQTNRLDEIQHQLEDGSIPISLSGAGSDLIQIIDAEGKVVAASDRASGISVLTSGLKPGETRESEISDIEIAYAPSAGPSAQSKTKQESSSGTASSSDESSHYSDPGYSDYSSGYDGSYAYSDDDDWSDDYSGYSDYEYAYDDYDYDYEAPSADGYSDYGSSDYSLASASFAILPNAMQAALGSSPAQAISSWMQPKVAYAAELGNKTNAEFNLTASELIGMPGPFLMLERGVSTPDGDMSIVSITSLAPALEAASDVTFMLSMIMLLALGMIAFLSWHMAGRTLRPVERMRSTASNISTKDLSARIPVPDGDPELTSLAVTFNQLLSRLEASMMEQKRFVSNASHELKSPVAAIRIMLETMQDHGDLVDVDLLVKDLMTENDRVGGIVSNLLLLAQHDEGCPRIDKHPIDLCDLLYEEATALKARSKVSLDVSGITPIVCTADATAMRHAIRNLLDNAARYAKSTVKLSCDKQGDSVRVTISDDGPGIPVADRERIFGRFVRLEEGRSRKEGSTGLGLSVVKTIAEQHGGTARFVDGELGGATAELIIAAE